MNEAQETKVKKISELWTNYQDCCNAIEMLTDRKRECNNQKSLTIYMFEYIDTIVCGEAKIAILTGAINELNHLKETIKVKLSNELEEPCPQ